MYFELRKAPRRYVQKVTARIAGGKEDFPRAAIRKIMGLDRRLQNARAENRQKTGLRRVRRSDRNSFIVFSWLAELAHNGRIDRRRSARVKRESHFSGSSRNL
jgi:uncharacterized protein (DUF2336 family)